MQITKLYDAVIAYKFYKVSMSHSGTKENNFMISIFLDTKWNHLEDGTQVKTEQCTFDRDAFSALATSIINAQGTAESVAAMNSVSVNSLES